MKKIISTVITSFFALTIAYAQLPNNGFEKLHTNQSIQYWGYSMLISITIDSNGVAHPDSTIGMDKLLYSTPDASSGSKAMAMQTGFNWTANKIISPSITCGSDSNFGNFAPLLTADTPAKTFSFWYKYMPVGGDSAFAQLICDVGTMQQDGKAEITLAPSSVYKHVVIPIDYANGIAAPSIISVVFRSSKNSLIGKAGSLLIVDDVNVSSAALPIASALLAKKHLIVSPIPAQDIVAINDLHAKNITLSNMAGQRIILPCSYGKIDCSALARGMYQLMQVDDCAADAKIILE